MKKFLAAIVLIFGLAFTSQVSTHELLPKEVVKYLQENPNATPEQIKSFVEKTSPELAEKYESKEDLVGAVKGSQNLGFFPNAWLFIQAGIGHILSGPDHILFVLSLLLVFISFKHILKLSSAFTIAHSITLILAGTAVFTLSSNIVEPIIALSISYVAFTAVYFKNKSWASATKTVPIVFLFGLFHGLGFAGLLQEIEVPKNLFVSSLLFFNVGVELGQLVIIAVVLPAIYLFKDKLWYGTATKVFGTIFGLLGIFWGIQRIFFS